MQNKVFLQQLTKCFLILNKLELVETYSLVPPKIKEPGALFRQFSYKQIWEYIYKSNAANFVLFDQSLLLLECPQFNGKYSLAYYDNPYSFITEEEFRELFPEATNEQYRQYLKDEVELNKLVTPIRYDYDPTAYSNGIHPAAHLHIGHKNQIRIGCQHKITPLFFLSFIIRQCYPAKWRELFDQNFYGTNIKSDIKKIDNIHFNNEDEIELYLQSKSVETSTYAV
ncbi:MAG: DUF2290 domain-containing protein [Desulfovibrio sp.]|uniref:DUF2290 domain-containing protein n=1 Tax=Desulfovibrio sp. TaxID=885 RepID=UPI0039E5036A